jgi:hypothetical protein
VLKAKSANGFSVARRLASLCRVSQRLRRLRRVSRSRRLAALSVPTLLNGSIDVHDVSIHHATALVDETLEFRDVKSMGDTQ